MICLCMICLCLIHLCDMSVSDISVWYVWFNMSLCVKSVWYVWYNMSLHDISVWYVCMCCTFSCVDVQKPEEDLGCPILSLSVLVTISLSPLRQSFELKLEQGWQQESLSLLSLSPTGLQAHMRPASGFLCGRWGFELRSSCLWSKHSYLLSYCPCPRVEIV